LDGKAENTESYATLRLVRRTAEKKNQSKFDGKLAEVNTLKLIHELEVHQIELEMQTKNLLLAKSKQNIQLKIKLYDYAPSGYFTL
jgi:hypothetical protein